MASKFFKPELVISVAALILSVVATMSAIYFSYVGLKTNVLPTMVFVYSTSSGWSLRNVGNGPALNVVVAYQPHAIREWHEPTRLYPIARGEGVNIEWIKEDANKLIATYTDAHNRRYTSLTDEDVTTISDGVSLVRWDDSKIKRVWEMQGSGEPKSRVLP